MSPISAGRRPGWKHSLMTEAFIAVVCVSSLSLMSADAAPASAAELTRRADVGATPATVWAAIGPFCAIKDWHPAVGSCALDGKVPPTRTLVTKDGKATFVEAQVARDDARYTSSYSFVSSPFPVTQYVGTIAVSSNGRGGSTITWHGVYTPLPGKEQAANDAFASIYEPGLAALKTKFAN